MVKQLEGKGRQKPCLARFCEQLFEFVTGFGIKMSHNHGTHQLSVADGLASTTSLECRFSDILIIFPLLFL
jgi:hypothetical protein